jgi:hypothetical protein
MSFDIFKYQHGAPCSSDEFEQAQGELGHRLPDALVEVYTQANGFNGPTGAAFLYPLISTTKATSAVSHTLYLRSDPVQPEFWAHCIAFGDFGVGGYWGIEVTTQRIFEWWPEDGDEITYIESSINELWRKKEAWYAKSAQA